MYYNIFILPSSMKKFIKTRSVELQYMILGESDTAQNEKKS